jgi:flagellar basal body-associated protein FliL
MPSNFDELEFALHAGDSSVASLIGQEEPQGGGIGWLLIIVLLIVVAAAVYFFFFRKPALPPIRFEQVALQTEGVTEMPSQAVVTQTFENYVRAFEGEGLPNQEAKQRASMILKRQLDSI